MPGRNATGPMGQGPLTGRGMGPCGGGAAYGGRIGRGRRMSSGYGMHMGRNQYGYYPQVELSADQQKEMLTNQKAILESELAALQKKLEEL